MKISVSVVLLMAASTAVRAEEIEIDFDGTTPSVNFNTGPGTDTLADRLAVAAAKDNGDLPATRWGQIPMPSEPFCVDCQNGDNTNGEWPVPTPNPYADVLVYGGPFVTAVCLNTGSYGDGCEYLTGEQAAVKLGNSVIKDIFMEDMKNKLSFRFPLFWARDKAREALIKMEQKTVKLVKDQVTKDLKKIVPMPWETPAQTAQKMNMVRADEAAINVWWSAARQEALYPNNWAEVSEMTFSFKGGPSYLQLARTLQCRQCFRSRDVKFPLKAAAEAQDAFMCR